MLMFGQQDRMDATDSSLSPVFSGGHLKMLFTESSVNGQQAADEEILTDCYLKSYKPLCIADCTCDTACGYVVHLAIFVGMCVFLCVRHLRVRSHCCTKLKTLYQ